MRVARLVSIAAAASLLAACGPTLKLSPGGWKEDGAAYTIAPAPDGGIMPAGWSLASHTRSGDGFSKASVNDMRDLELKRTTDDGVLVVVTESIAADDAEKKPAVLADRWLDTLVSSPKQGINGVVSLDGRSGLYDDVLPKPREVGTVTVGWRSASVTELARHVQVLRRAEFAVAGGEGGEVEADLLPNGAPGPDRNLYVAILRSASKRDRIVVVAYSNTPSMFAPGVEDASGLAHRLRF
jgi:hypothetical protein